MKQASHHWHRCSGPDEVPMGPNMQQASAGASFAVQGIVTDQLAQMVFNKALGPKSRHAKPFCPSQYNRPPVHLCADCAEDLIPFQVKPDADFTCHDGLPQSGIARKYQTDASIACPGWCMSREPNEYTQTQSERIAIRRCEK